MKGYGGVAGPGAWTHRERIERRLDLRRIAIAAFRQGGAVALHTALRYPQRLAGVRALSTYLPAT